MKIQTPSSLIPVNATNTQLARTFFPIESPKVQNNIKNCNRVIRYGCIYGEGISLMNDCWVSQWSQVLNASSNAVFKKK